MTINWLGRLAVGGGATAIGVALLTVSINEQRKGNKNGAFATIVPNAILALGGTIALYSTPQEKPRQLLGTTIAVGGTLAGALPFIPWYIEDQQRDDRRIFPPALASLVSIPVALMLLIPNV